jgi:ABC-type polysaccharide/polyol phosphate transport system ATPase subunit
LFSVFPSHILSLSYLIMFYSISLPTPRAGQVLGLVGKNGIGKSTALKVLAGKMKPNLGNFTVRYLLRCLLISRSNYHFIRAFWFVWCTEPA